MKAPFFNKQKDLPLNLDHLDELVGEVFSLYGFAPEELIVHFVDKKTIAKLHKEHFDDPSPTDCITFPIDDLREEGCLAGEIFICPQVALEYDPMNPYLETTLYIVHAILHIIGFDDIDPQEEPKMRQEEKRVLEHLMKKNLVLSNSFPVIH